MDDWVRDLEATAAAVLPEPVRRYVCQGAGDGVSTAEAVGAWRGFRFRPHVLQDVSGTSDGTSLLGIDVRLPVAIAPSTLQRQLHPDGEVEMARGAAAAGALMCVSSNAGSTFADIAATGVAWWVQMYVLRDRDLTERTLHRAVDAGARAVVLTADTPIVGSKHDGPPSVWDLVAPGHLHRNLEVDDATDLTKADDLTPDIIGWLGETTGLPVVVKGVLRADDAADAVRAGASAIWVSNHGGRQLDRSVATAEALPGVADGVSNTAGGRAVEVYVDGGLRSGLDIVAALALGARGVFLGRPAMWALATAGAAGVERLLTTLGAELDEALRLAGAPSPDRVPADLVEPGSSPRRLV